MKKITAKRDYVGCEINEDGTTGQDFSLVEGESRQVSDQKAEQLREDFPDWFDFGGRAEKKAAKQTEEKTAGGGSEGGDEKPDYSKLKNDDLEAAIVSRGLTVPAEGSGSGQDGKVVKKDLVAVLEKADDAEKAAE